MNTAPFQKLKDASTTTGLSQFYLRRGCRDGTIPHIVSGNTYYINIPKLLEKLGVTQSGMGQTEAQA